MIATVLAVIAVAAAIVSIVAAWLSRRMLNEYLAEHPREDT